MSSQPFSETEIETLRKGATGAGLLVAVSDKGFFDTFKETGAMAEHLAKAKQGSSSPLIQQLAEGRGTGFGPHFVEVRGRSGHARGPSLRGLAAAEQGAGGARGVPLLRPSSSPARCPPPPKAATRPRRP